MAKRLLVLASGRGSNFVAIAQAAAQGKLAGASISGLISSNPQAPVLNEARRLNVNATCIPWNGDRAEYDRKLDAEIDRLAPDLICLAGYLRLLAPELVRKWPQKILNVHPSLLPSFKGLRAQQQAIDYGVKWTGCTVHYVTEELDAGPILVQKVLEMESGESAAALSQRLLPLEHAAYVEALAGLCRAGD